MSTFIELHVGNFKRYVNVDNVCYIEKDEEFSAVHFSRSENDFICVNETPEEILELINEAMFNGFSSSTVGTGKIRIVKYSEANK